MKWVDTEICGILTLMKIVFPEFSDNPLFTLRVNGQDRLNLFPRAIVFEYELPFNFRSESFPASNFYAI